MNKTCLVIAGPTAVGKTNLSIQIAKAVGTEIISADSRQCFRELNIGVAKPSAEELHSVPHHFINNLTIFDDFSAADYETYALNKLSELFVEKDIVVVTGGTGLYLRALTDGLDDIPEPTPQIRKEVLDLYASEGLKGLQSAIAIFDEQTEHHQNIHNPQRLMRALEVYKTTGKPISFFQKKAPKKRPFDIVKVFLNLSRGELYSKINQRVDVMLKEGLLEEAKELYRHKNLNSLQTVGYKEMFQYLDGDISISKAAELVKQHSRNYAKRQITWFKSEPGMHACNADIASLKKLLNKLLPGIKL
jgi:tRNA dimethylallyltransferase